MALHGVQRAPEVLIVGAGMSGVAAAIALRRAGWNRIAVLEKSAELGGTWRDNSYPGCGCDVPALLYEYSFAPHSWKRCFADQPEILDYLRDTAAASGVLETIHYDTTVLQAHWNRHAHHWNLETSTGPYTARILIVATGSWHRPRYPDIADLRDFPGPVFHSARWDHETDLTGRTVAVVGTGASTAQFLPRIQPRAARVEIFQSTAPWVLPKPDYPFPPPLRHYLLGHPAARRALRGLHNGTQEGIGFFLRHPHLLPPLETAARLYLRHSVSDRALRHALTPTHRLGARRLLTSGTYYPALTRPNVRLHSTRATRVEKRQIIGADGTRVTADAIVLATGFHIGELSIASRLHGAQGTPLAQTWRNGRHAYLGTSVSGYPNLFLLLGPNILNGTTAAPTVMEAQLRYITDALTHLRHTSRTSLDVRPEIQDDHQAAVQTALQSTVYTTDPTSYYYSSPGANTFCWPWSLRRLKHHLNTFTPTNYTWTPTPLRAPSAGGSS